jgi:hypothetical protein
MLEKTQRFLVESGLNGADQLALAMTRTLDWCKDKRVARIVLVVPVLQHVHATAIASVLGKDSAKSLAGGEILTFAGSTTMASLLPAAKINTAPADSFLVGVHLALSDMGKVDDTLSAAGVAYCPWTESEGKQ